MNVSYRDEHGTWCRLPVSFTVGCFWSTADDILQERFHLPHTCWFLSMDNYKPSNTLDVVAVWGKHLACLGSYHPLRNEKHSRTCTGRENQVHFSRSDNFYWFQTERWSSRLSYCYQCDNSTIAMSTLVENLSPRIPYYLWPGVHLTSNRSGLSIWF